ncbi:MULTISPECIES: MarR family winged helix-turn-helix transcriptional regulator [unclassified Micromonospora]|uniref:MarR family winged helix-turn-helix transcriptional regulator n=1 Tax=unclassified Micromonospora TaxID=2617518 RepID=UPI001C5E5D7D|nr:MarR family winged helix-turn-helix transcriptional regulator [Micromonospora sp. RL09-050-HVF-A]MBW4704555.1 winged helix-turn-helix transcriptional regulator [Micromonospora sp. RL09-050-HVF-A]
MSEHEPAQQPGAPPARLRRLTSWLLHHGAARANRVVGTHLDRPGDRMRYGILAALDEFGGISQAELCRRLGIDRGDAVTTLSGMETDGLLRREPDPVDRRRNVVHITDAGTARMREMDTLVDAAQNDLLDRFTVAERAQFSALLRRLVDIPPP